MASAPLPPVSKREIGERDKIKKKDRSICAAPDSKKVQKAQIHSGLAKSRSRWVRMAHSKDLRDTKARLVLGLSMGSNRGVSPPKSPQPARHGARNQGAPNHLVEKRLCAKRSLYTPLAPSWGGGYFPYQPIAAHLPRRNRRKGRGLLALAELATTIPEVKKPAGYHT